MNIFAAQMNISGESEVSFIPLGVVVCLILCKLQFLCFIFLCGGASVVQTRFSRTVMNILLQAYFAFCLLRLSHQSLSVLFCASLEASLCVEVLLMC